MTTLREAAQQALEAYSGGPHWRAFADAMEALRAALAEEALQRLTDVQQEIQTALAEPEGDALTAAYMLGRHDGKRKPLTDEEINDLIDQIPSEDIDSWSFRQGVYVAEEHHGVRP